MDHSVDSAKASAVINFYSDSRKTIDTPEGKDR